MHLVLSLTIAITALLPGIQEMPGQGASLRDIPSRNASKDAVVVIPPPMIDINGMADRHWIELTIDGTSLTIELQQNSIRHPAFRMIIDHGTDATEFEPQECGAFRGRVIGRPDSRVAMHYGEFGWSGVVCPDDGGKPLFIQPTGHEDDHYTIGRRTLEFPAVFCAVTEQQSFLEGDPPLQGMALGATDKVLEVAIDVDKAYADLLGGDATTILSDVESIINVTGLIYEMDFNLELLITAIIIRDDPGAYPSTTAQGLTCDAMELWSRVVYYENYLFDVDAVQVFTGKDLGSQIGYAYIGTACMGETTVCGSTIHNPNKSCVESRFDNDFAKRVALSAHEFGHTLGAYHCSGSSCSIMCPTLGSCGGIDGSSLGFGTSARMQIGNYLLGQQSACIAELKTASELPFLSDFNDESPGENPDMEQWEYVSGASVPFGSSGDAWCQLNTYVSNPAFYSSIISKRIDLANRTDGTFSLDYQRQTAQSTTERLLIDGLDRNGNWQELDVISQFFVTGMIRHTIDLPEEIHWEGARFRIRTNSSNGHWKIDNVEVTAEDTVSNDVCSSALQITAGLNEFTTAGAAQSNPQVDAPCGDPQDLLTDVWFEYEPRCTGIATVTTCQLNAIDFQIRIYQDNGTMPCGDGGVLTRVACGQTEQCTPAGALAQFEAEAGERYLVQCGTLDGTTGSGLLYLNCEPQEKPDCVGDFNGDGTIDGQDLATLLASWGDAEADLDGDGVVSGPDLAIVLGVWGDCE